MEKKSTKQEPTLLHNLIGFGTVMAIVIFFAVKCGAFGESDGLETAGDPKVGRIESMFSVWDGSLRPLVQEVKATMKDPDSFEHVETVYFDQGDTLIVKTKYSGTNSFGARVTHWVYAKVGLEGEVLSMTTE